MYEISGEGIALLEELKKLKETYEKYVKGSESENWCLRNWIREILNGDWKKWD